MTIARLTDEQKRLLDEYDPALKEVKLATLIDNLVAEVLSEASDSDTLAATVAGHTTTIGEHTTTLGEHTTTLDAAVTLVNDIRAKLKGNYLISLPGLAIGTSAPTAIKITNDFNYIIGGIQYKRATAEIAFAGTEATIPETGDLYGAWRLLVDADGIVTIQEAADNATGYADEASALAGLPAVTEGNVVVGTVTVLAADGTAFVPATTELGALGITAAYVDGQTAFEAIGAAVS